MLRLLILAVVTSPICSRPGFRSSLMHGEKPILRMGPDEAQDNNDNQNQKEPSWVTNLRSNIQQQIQEYGFEDAKPMIKEMIAEANQQINGHGGAHKYPDILAPVRGAHNKRPISSPVWEKELKAYIKELIATYGRTNLDGYVRPMVESIERAQQITIKDIDVNPYDIPVNPQLRQGRMSPRYTMAPDD